MKRLLILVAVAVTCSSPLVAHADLVGTSVNGDFELNALPGLNLFDPANGLVPGGYGNSPGLPVTVGAGIEFAVSDGNILYTFDFSGTGLTAVNSIATPGPEGGFVATFTDSGFTGLNLATISNTLSGLSVGLSGDVLTVTFAGFTPTSSGVQGTGMFSLTTPSGPPPPALPEPGTLALIGTGVVGLAGAIRRRLS